MKDIIAYNSVYYFDREFSHIYPKIKHMEDVKLFGGLFYLYARNMSINDRTGTIQIPLKTAVLKNCLLPEYKQLTKSFEEVCNDRAKELMAHAITTKRKLAVMWSGGVDSTLILTSLLKNCSDKEIRDYVVVLMSQESIVENPYFYDKFILPNFSLIPANNFAHIMGDDNYVYVTGEGNDQLFATLFVIEAYKVFFNNENAHHETLDDDKMISFVKYRTGFNETHSAKLYYILKRLCAGAPVNIDTPYKFFWWNNFTLKWQNVYVRSMLFAHPINRNNIKLEDNYTTFFHTDDFQLWSMNTVEQYGRLNPNDSNKAYKEICKEIIYEFDKNLDYRLNKPKHGSFGKVIMSRHACNFVTEDIEFYNDIDFMDSYNPNNDFK